MNSHILLEVYFRYLSPILYLINQALFPSFFFIYVITIYGSILFQRRPFPATEKHRQLILNAKN